MLDIADFLALLDDFIGRHVIELHNHHGRLAAVLAADAHERDVNLVARKNLRDLRDDARTVAMDGDERRIRARKLDLVAVDIRNQDVAAANRGAADTSEAACDADQADDGRIRMGVRQLNGLEAHIEPLALRDGKGVADALVVLAKAEDARNERLVCAMAAIRLGKRARELDVSPHGHFAEHLPRHEPEPHGPRRMRARRPNHDRADDVENSMHKGTASLFNGKNDRTMPGPL